MKIVTFMSFKGGAGKTTALMAIASCLIQRGKKLPSSKPTSTGRFRSGATMPGARKLGTTIVKSSSQKPSKNLKSPTARQRQKALKSSL
ncbi:AAA family ATPase [Labrenzia suaedae]|uniref:AAA family ATPase n=1 Tax=Roseibium litorale TaxID=2803841 RepID=A0ABR9CRR7_9HYPH|nr:AAA family ATPase [Roseibium litorale]